MKMVYCTSGHTLQTERKNKQAAHDSVWPSCGARIKEYNGKPQPRDSAGRKEV